jgi:acyl dehydratase
MQFGRCFEEFEVGAVYKHWPGRTITEYDDTFFCMLTMNHHPLHIDANYAENTPFKQRLVVGSLVFSIVLGMTVEDVSGKAIANLEFEHVKHVGPTFHGDTIYAETTVLDKQLSRSKPDRGIVTVETIAYNQRGETVLSFKRRVMVPTRAYDEAQQRMWEEKMTKARERGTEQ